MSFRGRSAGRFCARCDTARDMARSAAVTVSPEPRIMSLAQELNELGERRLWAVEGYDGCWPKCEFDD